MKLANYDVLPLILGLPYTIAFNLRYFPLSVALRLPVLLSNQVWLKRMNGRVIIEQPSPGIVRIGFGDVPLFDKFRDRTIWDVTGTVIFKGSAALGHGTRLQIAGELTFGDGFRITAASAIRCAKRIVFGRDVLVSWDTLFMDSDAHAIQDSSGAVCNPDAEVLIGNASWIGCRSTILKGTAIPSNSVVAANSLVCGKFTQSNQIIAGVPAKTIKEGIRWSKEPPTS